MLKKLFKGNKIVVNRTNFFIKISIYQSQTSKQKWVVCCMINFIICDDKQFFIDKIIEIIDMVMIKKHQAYKTYKFHEYNNQFMAAMNSDLPFKIYILDIEVGNKSGIDIARKIREHDIESMIIFITSFYEKYIQDILKSKFMFLDFINKQNDYKKELTLTLEYALQNISKKNIIRFKSQGVIYTLFSNDILYIIRDKDRKCTIKTTTNEYTISKPLVELYDLLDERFIYSHRACIVNQDRIKIYNKRKRTILFDDNTTLDVVSNLFNLKYK